MGSTTFKNDIYDWWGHTRPFFHFQPNVNICHKTPTCLWRQNEDIAVETCPFLHQKWGMTLLQKVLGRIKDRGHHYELTWAKVKGPHYPSSERAVKQEKKSPLFAGGTQSFPNTKNNKYNMVITYLLGAGAHTSPPPPPPPPPFVNEYDTMSHKKIPALVCMNLWQFTARHLLCINHIQ